MENKILFDLKNKHEPNIDHGGLRCVGQFKENKKDQPLITIITTVKNGEEFLEEAILSLRKQAYKNFEHIIIDANSSDGTLKIVKKYNDQIDYW